MTTKQKQQFAKALKLATLLTEQEWRTIHNMLSIYQSQMSSTWRTDYATQRRAELQQLMDKIRDNFIAPAREDRVEFARPLSDYIGAEIDEHMKDQ